MPIHQLTDLESDAGETIYYDLSMQITGTPVEGDARIDEAYSGPGDVALTFYTDQVHIDQSRQGVSAGGRMTRKRTIHDLREIALKRQSDYWGRLFDEELFMYLSGARGSNADFIQASNYTGRASNAFSAPDAEHYMLGGDATAITKSTGDIAVGDVMTLALIDKLVTTATMMGGGAGGTPAILPISYDGEQSYVLVMNPYQVYDVRRNANTGEWLDIQKAAAAAEGRKNPIFRGSLGMYNGVILHEHKSIVRFDDMGPGSNVDVARALFLGDQAGVLAFGSTGKGLRFDWHEETVDRGNEIVITAGCIWGAKKTTFNSKDFGVIAVDTAAKAP
jgi:N4-gp56 family major capsid protein